jgi:hypothetical protein
MTLGPHHLLVMSFRPVTRNIPKCPSGGQGGKTGLGLVPGLGLCEGLDGTGTSTLPELVVTHGACS